MARKAAGMIIKYSGLAMLLMFWEAAPRFGWVDSQFLPSFSKTMLELVNLWVNGDLFQHIMVSLWRSLNGLIIAAVISIPLGLLLGRCSAYIIDAFNPLFRLLAQLNPFSLMPVFILFFGIGEVAKLAVVIWVCIWPILFNTVTGVRTVDSNFIKSATALNISKIDLLTKVVFPASAPSIFTGLRVGVEMSFFMLIAAEMIGANAGLGWLMHNSAMNYHIPRIYAAGFCIVLLGVLLNKVLYFLQSRLFFWKETTVLFVLPSEERTVKKFNKTQLAFIAILFAVLIIMGTFQVNKANLEGSSMEHHNHLKMDSATGSW